MRAVDDLSTQARELVERYRRSVHAMSAEHSAEVAEALAKALRAVERARTRDTQSDEETAENAVRAVRLALDSAGDPF
jgi:hypothetical protein